jgi:hypothetical protein
MPTCAVRTYCSHKTLRVESWLTSVLSYGKSDSDRMNCWDQITTCEQAPRHSYLCCHTSVLGFRPIVMGLVMCDPSAAAVEDRRLGRETSITGAIADSVADREVPK